MAIEKQDGVVQPSAIPDIADDDDRRDEISGRRTDDLETGAECLQQLTQNFELSARRWELIIYPSLFAFIILASYGFYLIYSLTSDISFLAKSVDRNMAIIASRMGDMSNDFKRVNKNMDEISVSVAHMSVNVRNMSKNLNSVSATMYSVSNTIQTLQPMLQNMDAIKHSLRSMTVSTGQLRNDVGSMNNSISRPMSFMNSFMPW